MSEEDRRRLAGLLNKLADEPAGGEYSDAIADVAVLAGLNWSDNNGWVIPGDE